MHLACQILLELSSHFNANITFSFAKRIVVTKAIKKITILLFHGTFVLSLPLNTTDIQLVFHVIIKINSEFLPQQGSRGSSIIF